MSTRAFTCHPTLTTTGPVPFKIQTTELVVINSSVPKGVGPHPRVLKCMDDYYLLPRSPESPTLQMQQRHESASLAVGISGSLRARHAAQYASTKGEFEYQTIVRLTFDHDTTWFSQQTQGGASSGCSNPSTSKATISNTLKKLVSQCVVHQSSINYLTNVAINLESFSWHPGWG